MDDERPERAGKVVDDAAMEPGLPEWRVTGGRGQLGGAFLNAVQADFAVHGVGVIARIREEKPESYLKLVASLQPKDLSAAAGGIDELSDEQLIERIRALDAAIRPLLDGRKPRARRSRRSAPQIDLVPSQRTMRKGE
ncbi:hypothetical protein [Ensifer sp. WSM1721]|uniref:hypothetical protein n=1 Tax=Ensifer sp. WSM1721 TaxID=1041159 RepID=UPI000479A4C1